MSSKLLTGDTGPDGLSKPIPDGRRIGAFLIHAAGRTAVLLVVVVAIVLSGVPDLGSRPALAPGQLSMLPLFPPDGGDKAEVLAEEPIPALGQPAPMAASEPTPTEEPVGGLATSTTTPTSDPTATPATPTSAPTTKPARFQSYRVQPGDSLYAIATRFGITPETVLWANDLGNGELLLAGQEVNIPPVSGILHTIQRGDTLSAIAEAYCVETGPILAANDLNPAAPLPEGGLIVVPGGVKRTTQPIEGLPSAPSKEEVEKAPRYLVRAGDSLISIADSFAVRPSVIQVANDLLNPDLLRAGQELVIPGGKQAQDGETARTRLPGANPTPAPGATATATQAPPTRLPSPTSAPAVTTTGGSYVVKAGDTLYSIARSLGVQPAALQEANGISDPTKIKIGQQLTVPAGVQGTAVQKTATMTATAGPTATKPPAPTATATPQPVAPTARPAQTPTQAAPPAPPPPAPPVPSHLPKAERIAAVAQHYLGYRYLWGGHSPTGFDCTGFTWFVYKQAGFNIPQHDLPGQLGAGPRIPREQLAQGDLVFFQNTYTAGLSHVGIYLGGGRFINAETERVGVQIRSLNDPYWSARFVGASRP